MPVSIYVLYEDHDLEKYRVIYCGTAGVPHQPYDRLYILQKNGGGLREIIHLFPPVNDWGTTTHLENIRVSDDGEIIYFTAYDPVFGEILDFKVTLFTGKLLRAIP